MGTSRPRVAELTLHGSGGKTEVRTTLCIKPDREGFGRQARNCCPRLTLAAMILQADSPVLTLALSVQLRMDSRDEAGLLLGPQGHVTQVGPAAQAIGAASPTWRVESVEVAAPVAPYAQQLEAGQHGLCSLHTTSSTSGDRHLSHSRAMHGGLGSLSV